MKQWTLFKIFLQEEIFSYFVAACQPPPSSVLRSPSLSFLSSFSFISPRGMCGSSTERAWLLASPSFPSSLALLILLTRRACAHTTLRACKGPSSLSYGERRRRKILPPGELVFFFSFALCLSLIFPLSRETVSPLFFSSSKQARKMRAKKKQGEKITLWEKENNNAKMRDVLIFSTTEFR